MDFKIAIETFDEEFPLLIDPSIDYKGSLIFTTIRDKQRLAVVKVFLVNSKGKFFLREFKVSHITEAPAGTPRIKISGKISKNNLKLKIEYDNKLVEEDILSIKKYTRTYTGLLLLLISALLITGIYYAKSTFFTEDTNSDTDTYIEEKTDKENIQEEQTENLEIIKENYEQETEENNESETIITEEEIPEAVPEPVILNKSTSSTIYFDPDKSELDNNGISALENLVKELEKARNINIDISGHSAPKGFEKGRKKLSERRAETIKNYLTGKLEYTDISTESYGDKKPVTMDPKKQNLNRRAELTVSYQIEEKQE